MIELLKLMLSDTTNINTAIFIIVLWLNKGIITIEQSQELIAYVKELHREVV